METSKNDVKVIIQRFVCNTFKTNLSSSVLRSYLNAYILHFLCTFFPGVITQRTPRGLQERDWAAALEKYRSKASKVHA